MQTKRLSDGQQRTFALVFETGEDPMAGLQMFADTQGITAASFEAIGAFRRAVLGFFDFDKKDYERLAVEEQAEVVSLLGNIALKDGKPKLHIHAVLGKRDGAAIAGHLLEAEVRPTLEVVLTVTPAHLARTIDATTGLPLISSGV